MTHVERHVEPVGHSQFMMWRCITAMAHADNRVKSEESEYLTSKFTRMGLDDAQRETLLDDLENAKNFEAFLPQVNEAKFRSQIVYFARVLAAIDGNICPSEQEMLDKLHAQTIGQIDIDAIRDDIQTSINNETLQHDLEIAKNRPGSAIGSAIDKILLNLGIDFLA